jgi:hypothetical protein
MSKKKPIIHDTAACRDVGIFNIRYDDDNTPWLECSNCGKVIDDWRRWRDSYSSFWQDPQKWDSKKDHLVCLLGYFAEQYKRYYGFSFTFSLNDRGLFNGVEIFCIRKVYAMLGNDALLSKEYIDWIFTNKVSKKNKKITSLSFLTVPDLVQEFKFYRNKARKITRDKPLPEKMISWIQDNCPEVLNIVSLRDFGELRMALLAYRDGHLDAVPDFKTFVDRLRFNNIVDEKMNIVGWSE